MHHDNGDFARISALEENLKKVTAFAKRLKNDVETLKSHKGDRNYEKTETSTSRDFSRMQKEIDRLGRLVQDTHRYTQADVNGIQSRLEKECEKMIESKFREMGITPRVEFHYDEDNDDRFRKLQRQVEDLQDTVESMVAANGRTVERDEPVNAPFDDRRLVELEEEIARMGRRFDAIADQGRGATEPLMGEIDSVRRRFDSIADQNRGMTESLRGEIEQMRRRFDSIADQNRGISESLRGEIESMRRRFDSIADQNRGVTESLKGEIDSVRRQLADVIAENSRARAMQPPLSATPAPTVDDDESSERSNKSDKSKDPIRKLKKEVKRLKEQMVMLKNDVQNREDVYRSTQGGDVQLLTPNDITKYARREDLEALREEQKKIKHDLKKVYMKLKKSYRKLRRAYKASDSDTSEFDSGSMLLSMNSENASASDASGQSSGDKNYTSKDTSHDADSKDRSSSRNSRGFMWDSKIRRASEAQKSGGNE